MSLRLLHLLLALLATLLMLRPALAEGILVLQPEDSGPYREFTEALALAIGPQRERYPLDSMTLKADGSLPAALPEGSVVVAVGSQAARAALAAPGRQPVLCVLMPRATFQALQAQHERPERPVSAVYLDQPLARQLSLAHLALPGMSRVGVLLGPESAPLADELRRAAQAEKLELAIETIQDPAAIIPALNRLLPQVDLLLALPDGVVYNRDTVRPVLLTTYRHQRPLMGFSRGYVTAGALLGLFSNPAHIARQVAEMLRQRPAGGLPPPRPPEYFDVAVNDHVARSLALDIASERTLHERLSAEREAKK